MVQTPIPVASPGKQGDIGYFSLWVLDAERAIAFYSALLGWEFDGRFINGVTPRGGVWAGEPSAPTVLLSYRVDDIGDAVRRVRAAGGAAGQPTRESYGASADGTDDQGVRFALWQPLDDAAAPVARRTGDVEYFTLGAPDADRTRAFYGAVLGWTFAPGNVPNGWQIENSTPMGGLWGGRSDRQRVQLMFRVDDAATAVARVRELGGRANEPLQMPYGLSVDCYDDQGMAFWLLQT